MNIPKCGDCPYKEIIIPTEEQIKKYREESFLWNVIGFCHKYKGKLRVRGENLLAYKHNKCFESRISELNISNEDRYYLYEALHHYIYEGFTDLYKFKLQDSVFWFLIYEGRVIDFYNFEIPYALASKVSFDEGDIETEVGYISDRGYEMSKHLGLI